MLTQDLPQSIVVSGSRKVWPCEEIHVNVPMLKTVDQAAHALSLVLVSAQRIVAARHGVRRFRPLGYPFVHPLFAPQIDTHNGTYLSPGRRRG